MMKLFSDVSLVSAFHCSIRPPPQSIFRGFMVPIDECDVSMDSTYLRELQAVLGWMPIVLPPVLHTASSG
ncbi:hypothetical protein MRB53_002328 [Persea americana]|uniref:Uncharacterized protein n=1 Tax=Persea americana TaxID=3435 RepID=A0ACC2MUG3_PERAE|nr:hypothetical protein MRB53_002328 [Persea americana]